MLSAAMNVIRPRRNRFFGDYPVTGTAYWIWIGGAVLLGALSLAVAIMMR